MSDNQELLALTPWPDHLEYLALRGWGNWRFWVTTGEDEKKKVFELASRRFGDRVAYSISGSDLDAILQLDKTNKAERSKNPKPGENGAAAPPAEARAAAHYFPPDTKFYVSPLMVKDKILLPEKAGQEPKTVPGTNSLIAFDARAAWQAGIRSVAAEVTRTASDPQNPDTLKVALVLAAAAEACRFVYPIRDKGRIEGVLEGLTQG